MKKSDCIALILAGGRGERLSVLTKEIPKPAIPFGGAYRLIDFTLSNCKHSGVNVIGILTQYRQRELAEYVSTGHEWFSAGKNTEIVMLPPKNERNLYGVYAGTADSVLKNSEYIEERMPENILVLSGDHVYKMDYTEMMATHEKTGAAVTIAAKYVSWNEAPRFGIINADNRNRIKGFEEKPRNPKSNLASMGVYIFNWKILKDHLHVSQMNPESSMDIGKNIIPQMLICGERMVVHPFDGYWKDVGSIYSLWEAHMELLSDSPSISLYEDDRRIISREAGSVQYHKYSGVLNGNISNSLITKGCKNRGRITSSVISADVEIGEEANIFNSVIMPGAKIGKGASVINAIIGARAVVGDYTAVSGVKPDGKYLDNCQGVNVIGHNVCVSGYSGDNLSFTVFPQRELCAV